MKLTDVTQWVRVEKLKSHQRRLATESVASLRAYPARVCAKPGIASVQAALLSSEKRIVVVRKDNPVQSWGKPTVLARRKASVLEAIGRAERTPPESGSGACTQRGSLGTREDRHLLVREQPEQYGEPVYPRARRERAVPSLLASREGHEPNGGASEVSGSERQSEAT
jgi:hypothetical protein